MDLTESWATVGISIDPAVNLKHRIEGLLNTIESSIPGESSHHGDWFHFAFRWSELLYLMVQAEPSVIGSYQEKFEELRNRTDSSFIDWTFKRYAGLSIYHLHLL